MDTPTLNELSVRRRQSAAQFYRGMRARGALSQLTNERLVILVHGLDVSAAKATSTYQSFVDEVTKADDQLAAQSFCAYWGFHWPSDHSGPHGVSKIVAKSEYSSRVEFARSAGEQLADLLSRLGSHQEVYFVAHSLGCRVVMETLFKISRWQVPWLGASVKGAFLMAAAVPWLFCTEEPPGGDPALIPHFFKKRPAEPVEWVFYSDNDSALNKAFKIGQWLHGEGGGEAVGRQGLPPGRWCHPVKTDLDHPDYWPNKDIILRVPHMLGLQTERDQPDRILGNRRPAHRLLPRISFPHRSVGDPIDDWEVLIGEDGSTSAQQQWLLR
jgi:hypothetical protein